MLDAATGTSYLKTYTVLHVYTKGKHKRPWLSPRQLEEHSSAWDALDVPTSPLQGTILRDTRFSWLDAMDRPSRQRAAC